MLSIIIPIHNLLDITKQCIDAISRNTSKFELILINNASDMNTLSVLESYKRNLERCILINNTENIGFIKACNQGAKMSGGEILCIMNNDVIVKRPDWCELPHRAFTENDQLGLVGAYSGYFSHSHSFQTKQNYNFIEGSCMFYRSNLYERYGLFDETLEFAYCEDVELSLRLKKLGYSIKQIDLPIVHLQRSTLNTIPNKDKIMKSWEKNMAIVRGKYKEDLDA